MFKIPNVSLAVNNFSEEFIVLKLQQHINFSTWTLPYITKIKILIHEQCDDTTFYMGKNVIRIHYFLSLSS